MLQGAGGLEPQVVPVHRDVQGAERDLAAGDLGELRVQPAGEVDTAGVDTEQDDVLGTLRALHDLVGDAGDDPGDVGAVEHLVRRARSG